MVLYPHSFDTGDLISGEVDAMSAYSTDEPFELEEAGIPYNILTPRAGGIDFYGDTLFTTESFIRDNPQVTGAFLDASIKGWEYALQNQEEIIDLLLAKYSTRHSRAHLEFEAWRSERLILPDVVEIGYMNPGRWQTIANTYADLNMIPADTSLDGFLYDRTPGPDLTWFYLGLGGAALVVGVAAVIALRFFRLNANLNRQISKRREIEEQLRESERQLQLLMSHLPGMVYRCRNDDHWTMLFVSSGCFELTGYKSEALLLNKSIAYANLIHPDDQAGVQALVTVALAERRPFKVTYRIHTRANESKWVWEQGRGVFSEDGELRFIEGFITDINEQKCLEAERESLIAELQHTLAEISVLRGIIPICASCKKIRDDQGYWHQVEVYIRDHSEVDFSHSICPECKITLYPGLFDRES
jgi:PAS domain S-box-containing protein